MKCSRCGGAVDEQFPSKCLTENCTTVMCDGCSLKYNFKCEAHSTVKKKIVLEEVRRSHIELYKKCPRAFELQVVEQKPIEMGVYADIGINLHTIFDVASKSRIFNKETMRKEYDDYFKQIPRVMFEGCQRKLSIDEFILQQHEKGYRNIEGFETLCHLMPIPWKTEERISVAIDGSNIRATIAFDRINQNSDGSYDLLDYKTGKVHVGVKLSSDLQPALYIKCVEENYGIHINRFIFLFTGECKERIFNRIGEDTFECMVGKKSYKFSISEKMYEISQLFKSIEKGDFYIPNELHPYTCENECGSFKSKDCTGKFDGKWENK